MIVTVCIPRKIAKERGIKRFMTGEPCAKSHNCARWVTDGRCCECVKEKLRRDYEKNPRAEYRKDYSRRPEVLARNAEFHRKSRKMNPDKYKEYDRKKAERIKNDPDLLEKERKRQNAKQKAAYMKDSERYKELRRKRYAENDTVREKNKQLCKQWKVANKDKVAMLNSKHNPLRRASKLNRTPKWLTDKDKKAMTEIYKMAKILCGHVDHIIPLQGKLVCGLHVPSNLQILTPEENLAKRNNYEVE